ncbi:hypothetical protein DCC81_24850 [Chitinophaga parva]|uniref:Uncharacterized protein n=2 Tax=Chitinophaga parva TaxID=2169414 RepID=A0A2T7BBQ9_9BACT|nr:hypothetical protein DCC81_24850 [Chitinophaga parva]
MASCSTLNKHKSITRTSSDSTGHSKTSADLQVHSVTSVKASRPVILAPDSLHAYGVFLPVDSGIVHLIHISNGNITMDVTAQRQPGGGIKVDAAATTPQKTVLAPVDSTYTVDSVSHSTQHSAATVHQETMTKDKQVQRKNSVPWWLWTIGGISLVAGLLWAAGWIYKRIKSKLPL